MLHTIKFNKIDENYVSEYKVQVINNSSNEAISDGVIPNTNNGPTQHTKKLPFSVNNIYFIDEHIHYSDFYEIIVHIDNKLINNINIEYNPLTKSFFLNNVNNVNINSDIQVMYYKNIIEHQLEIPGNCKVVITPVLYKKHYVGNHNVLY